MKTFKQWLDEEKNSEGSPLAAMNSKLIKTQRDRDRLTRIEKMLHELINLKQFIVDRRTNDADNQN